MSLELALQENTAAVLQLVAALKATPVTAPAVEVKTEKKAKPAPAQTAVTEPAGTQATAEQAAAPAEKASTSGGESPSPVENSAPPKAMTVEERTPVLTAAVAKAGRDAVIALLAEFGAKRAGEVPADKLAEFDTKLNALAA